MNKTCEHSSFFVTGSFSSFRYVLTPMVDEPGTNDTPTTDKPGINHTPNTYEPGTNDTPTTDQPGNNHQW
jgi:hypothetical protein